MALDRWIALILALVFLIYGYTAFFGMDHLLPPIFKRAHVWPSTFPKILSVVGVLAAIAVLVNIEKSGDDVDLAKLRQYKIIEALALIGGMITYALTLEFLGFLTATFLFIALSSILLGERRYVLLVVVALLASNIIWFLIDSVLGIYITPYPSFLGS